jgi:paraquat-inducible protein B
MATPDEPSGSTEASSTRVERRHWGASLIWLVPAVAVLLGLSMAIRAWSSIGPRVQISFNTAEGLEADKTQVRFKNVVIGSVGGIRLSKDRSRVIANVKFNKSASAFATEGTRFWVVRPRVGAGGISGIDTVLSGVFIGADPGNSSVEKKSFVGLETPPAVTQGEAGRQFLLRADDVGSLDIGSPIYYRRIQVGRMVGVKLGDDGSQIDVTIFVSAPYDRLVTKTTRFWNASGLDVSIGAYGVKVNTQSLATVLGGGIAFQSPSRHADPTPAPPDTVFTLATDQAAAMAPPDGKAVQVSMRFKQSVRGLAVDAPVEFEGVELGHVTSMDLDYDPQTKKFLTVVGAAIYPERMGVVYRKLLPQADLSKQSGSDNMVGALIDKGLRAQARSGNILTGQLYVAIEFRPDAVKVASNSHGATLEIPTVAGQLDKLQDQLASIVDRADKIPLDSIGKRLDASLGSLDLTLKQVNGDVLPALKDTLQGATQTLGAAKTTLGSVDGVVNDDSSMRRDLEQTLQELQRSARSLRDLTDYLERHPEALIRGRRKSERDPPPSVESTSGKP